MNYKFFLLIICLSLTQGCIDRRNNMSSDYIQNGGWANAPSPSTTHQQPLYCYNTLASVNCYAHQQIGQENRLVGQITSPPTPMETKLASTDIRPKTD